MNQISPRIFESMAYGSIPILFEGEYSNLLKPNINYEYEAKSYQDKNGMRRYSVSAKDTKTKITQSLRRIPDVGTAVCGIFGRTTMQRIPKAKIWLQMAE